MSEAPLPVETGVAEGTGPAAVGLLALNGTMRPAYRYFVLALVTVGFMLNFVDRQILTILMQPIKQEFHLSDSLLGLLSGLAFALFYATLGIPMSRLADRGSRQLLMSVSMGLWSLATAACGLAQSFWQLVLARMTVGVGEAGFTPAGLALIADYFPRSQRGAAMGAVNTGPMFGMMLGLVIGGWASSRYGWRGAFMLCGLPGVAFALLFRFTVREPWRGMADGEGSALPPQLSFRAALFTLWRNRAYRWLLMGSAMSAFGLYGESIWMPSFMARSHGLDPKQIGALLGPITGVVGGLGVVLGGMVCDRLGRRNEGAIFWVPAAGALLSIPALGAALLSRQTSVAAGLYALWYLASVVWVAPTFVAIQTLVPKSIRVSAMAWKLLLTSLIGLGLGPQLIGVASDALHPRFGADSLRIAMALGACTLWIPAVFYLMAARAMPRERAKRELLANAAG